MGLKVLYSGFREYALHDTRIPIICFEVYSLTIRYWAFWACDSKSQKCPKYLHSTKLGFFSRSFPYGLGKCVAYRYLGPFGNSPPEIQVVTFADHFHVLGHLAARDCTRKSKNQNKDLPYFLGFYNIWALKPYYLGPWTLKV